MNNGRPRKYDTPEDLGDKIEEYFANLEDKPPTVSGLARNLGFSSRQSMWDYGKDERFSYLISDARLRIENYWESKLATGACTGSIFWLKNHAGYTDKQEISGPDKGPIGFRFVDVPNTGEAKTAN